ncbi:pre-B-cell leukemia transcription factor-interacting protein 1 [Chanos chanos]|uniref:Pre-B-cell leukemia transcription factor-interacting protein 1 n=1 Tax=Chanos chanos TaxID=29144 RepID=A0A6J2WL88_CHACN|nr:pre-B-cell leukemia transcription factor-interacting protein 1-like [Chanos chanos]
MTDIKPAPEVCPSLDIHSDVSPIPESPPLVPSPSDSPFDFGSTRESPAPETLYPETTGTAPAEEREREETELAEKLTEVVKEPESLGADFGVDRPAVDDGLRLRHATPAVALRRTSDEEDEEEEEVFVPPKRKEEKRSFSLNQLIIGALVLLCLGSLFFSDDSDGVELTDQEVLSKLDQEKKQIAVLEAQLQAQREELDKALKMAADSATAEKENTKLKEQLSALPGLKEELETLRSRVIELRQLTAEEETPEPTSSSSQPSADSPGEAVVTPPRPDRWQDKKEKLQRQKMLLEQSRRRLEEMKKQGAYKKGVREMVEMQRRLSEQVEQLDKREGRRRKHQEDERKKREGGCEREKKRQGSGCWTRDEMMKRKDEKHGRDKRDGGWKEHDKTSHSREHWKKYRDQWEHKKDERRMERENRKKERPWQASRRQTSPHHQHDRHHHHHHHQQQHHSHQQSQKAQNNKLHSFWRHQEEKLRKNQRPPEGCRGIANCAAAEGFVPVQLAEFQPVLDQYLGKLQGLPSDNEEALRRLVAQFFSGGTFAHDRMSFGEFAEDVADVLEDLADILEDEEWGGSNDALEEEMEEFEKEVLWKFAAATA